MSLITCPHCGTAVRVAGLAAICPACGNVVSTIPLAPPERAEDVPIDPVEAEPLQPVIIESPGAYRSTQAMDQPLFSEPIPGLTDEIPLAGPLYVPPLIETVNPDLLPSLQPMPAEPIQSSSAPLAFKAKNHFQFTVLHAIISLVGVVVLIGITLIVLMMLRPIPAPPTPIAIAPPPAVVPSTQPSGSDWFNEHANSPPQQQALLTPTPSPPPPPVITTPPPATTPALPPPHADLAHLQPVPQPEDEQRVTDAQVGQSIQLGVNYLLTQFNEGRLRSDVIGSDNFAGADALAVYALIHSAQAIGDPRLTKQSPLIDKMLDRLRDIDITGGRSTYTRSLRISALSLLHRKEDKTTIDADLKWLIAASNKGGYDYDLPAPTAKRDGTGPMDNSNSQYGALGVWAAGLIGVRAPPVYWSDVEQHWASTQRPTGGWGYRTGDEPTLSMTAAGTTMLFVARDQMSYETPPTLSYTPLTKGQELALAWLGDGDHAIHIDGGHRGYTLYGLERAGLASGYKYFGQHDWYRELANTTVRQQEKDGSWNGGDGPIPETAFSLLFLARGRQPVFMSKLKFEGNWDNRPRDLETLTRYASDQLERPLNWQIADITHDWYAWSDSPVLLISSNKALNFPDDQIAKLRSFVQAGGLLFCNTERDNADFNASLDDLAKKLFPDFQMSPVPADSELFSIVYPMTDPPPLRGVNNGSRWLLVHSTQDLTRWWQPFPSKSLRNWSDVAINVAIYASGRRDLRNRLQSTFVPDPTRQPTGTIPLARLQYDGAWDPEPAAWPREAKLFQTHTSIAVQIQPTRIENLDYVATPIAHLTGLHAPILSSAQTDSLKKFVQDGGLLLIDACAGSKEFADAIESNLLPAIAGNALEPLPANQPLLAGTMRGMHDLRDIKVRLRNSLDKPPPIVVSTTGRGAVLFSRLDLTSGLLGTDTAGISGYQPQWAEDFVENTLLWMISRLPKQ